MNLRTIAIKLLNGELPPLSDGELSAERLKLCATCPEYRRGTRQCNLCGCFMDLKTKLLEAECPLQKW